MSRFNGPPLQHGAAAPQAGGTSEADPRTWGNPSAAPAGHGQASAPQQPYAPAQYQPAPYQALPEASLSQHQAHAPASQPFAYGQGHQDLGFGRQPQAPAAQAPQPAAYQPTQGFAAPQPGHGFGQQPAHQAYYNPQPEFAPAAPASNNGLRGSQFDQWSNAPATADTRSYEFSNFQQTAQQQGYAQPGAQSQSYGAFGQPAPAAQPHEWPAQNGFGAQPQFGHPQVDPGLDPNAGYHQGAQGAAGDQGYGEDEDYIDDEQPSSWKQQIGKIAAVLVAAVVVGVGGWTAYSYVLGPQAPKGPTPLVKNDASPLKEKPSNPGGKQFDHADSKILGRLGDEAPSSAATADDGAKKVSTVTVNPDGSIKAPVAEAAAAGDAAPPRPAGPAPTGVPGLSVVDVTGASAPAPAPPAAPAAGPQKAAAAAAPAAPDKPVIISKVQPAAGQPAADPAPAAPAADTPKKAAAASDKAPAAPKTEKKVAAAVDAPVAPKPTGAGYVAVLASVPATATSQLDALKQFADLKSKYGNLLNDKTPEVQVANLGAKGTYHRLLVGPPGSQESVKELCNNLKAAGFSGCWPLAY